MAWLYLIVAGLFEVLGVILLNELTRTNKKIYVILLALAFICSFSILKLAMHDIPMGTAYAIWTGIGSAGGAIVGMLFYNESTQARRLFFIGLIIVSVVGLKWLG